MIGKGIAAAGLFLGTAWLAIEGNDYTLWFVILSSAVALVSRWEAE